MILTHEVQLKSDTEGSLDFLLDRHGISFHVCVKDLSAEETAVIGNLSEEDQLLFQKEYPDRKLVVYLKDHRVLASIAAPSINFFTGDTSFHFQCENYVEGLVIKQTSETSVSLFNAAGELLIELDDIAACDSSDHVVPIDLNLDTVDYRYTLAGKISCGQFHSFLVYDLFRKELTVQNFRFKVLANHADGMEIRLAGPSLIEVSHGNDHSAVNFTKITGKGKEIFDFFQLEEHRDKHLLASFSINDSTYHIHNKSSGIWLTKENALKVSGFKAHLNAFFTSSHLYIYGRSTHYAYHAHGQYDYLYTTDSEQPLTKFVRPVKRRFFRRFGFFKVPLSAISPEEGWNGELYLGNVQMPLHPLKIGKKRRRAKIVAFKNQGDRVNLLTAGTQGNASLETSFHPEEFTLRQRLRNRFLELHDHKRVLQLYKWIFLVVGRLPKKRKLVLFESFHAKQFSDNPRAIYEYMKEHYKDYQLVWSIEKQSENLFKEFGVPYIRRFSIGWFLTFPRAGYWVNNVRLPAWMPKPRGTTYIQTWHGTPLKKLGIDIEQIRMPGTNTKAYRRNFISESKKWDYLVSPNPYSTEIFRSAFRYGGQIIESGYPRNDILTDPSQELISGLKRKIGIPEGKKIMLYAPTWRDNEFYEKGKYKFEFQFDLDRWKKEYGDEWILLSRMHYLVAENFDFSAHKGTVFNASSYPDIRDLYLISDLLITDYSSVFFDFAVLNRPIVFFTYDLETYRDQLRGLYFDIETEAPGPIVETEEELFCAIDALKDSDVGLNPKFRTFKERFSSLEKGQSAEQVVRAFLKE